LQFPVHAFRRLGRIYAPALAGLLIGGIYLASQLGIRAAWIPLALGATLLIAAAGGLITGRKMYLLRKMLSRETDSSELLLQPVRSKALVVSYGFRTGLAVGIVFLMSTTPSLALSLLALGIGPIAGILVALGLQGFSLRAHGTCNYHNAGASQVTQRS
jgi:hypothetical protein